MRTLGLLGGMSWESTAVYYRDLNRAVRDRTSSLGSARLILWSFDFAEIAALQHAGDWPRLEALLAEAGRRLEGAGAEALMICTNTMHTLAEPIQAAVGMPLLHIGEAVAGGLRARGCSRPLLLGTRFTMQGEVYGAWLRDGFERRTPDAPGRAEVHRIIYEELCAGRTRAASRARVVEIVERLAAEGADSVILGCTELTLLIGEGDVPIPVLDSTALHVEQGAAFALG